MIHELPHAFECNKILEEYNSCLFHDLQINISSHDGNTYVYNRDDSNERLRQNLNQEQYSVINSYFRGSYCEFVYNTLDDQYGVCRARFMTMTPKARAYSMHQDCAPRIHIPVVTNRECMFIVDDNLYKMPNAGQAYFIDTTKKHTALNLSWEDRIHLVFCIKRDETTIRQQSKLL